MTTIDLPSPPSVNNLYMNIPGKGRVTAPHYALWKDQAGWELKRQRPEKIKGPVFVKIEHEDAGKIDADNKLKAIFDLLVSHKIIEADKRSILRAFSFDWSPEVRGVRVTIVPVASASTQNAEGQRDERPLV